MTLANLYFFLGWCCLGLALGAGWEHLFAAAAGFNLSAVFFARRGL